MQYIKYDNDRSTIIMAADWPFPDSEPVEFDVVQGIDGKLYKAGDEPAPTQADLDAAYAAKIKTELQAIDAQSGRPARAVALAMVKGLKPDPEDVAKLEELEAQALALREELRPITARMQAAPGTEARML